MSETWRYISDYVVVPCEKVTDYSSRGFELVGGVVYNKNGNPYQTMVMYDDTVSFMPEEKKS